MNHQFLLPGLALLALSCLLITQASISPPTTSAHGTLTITAAGNVTYVTICNPPINLYDSNLSNDLYDFLTGLDPANRTTPPPKVVVFSSADPEFFIAHIDETAFLPPSTNETQAFANQYVAVTRLFQSLTTTVFIAEVDGLAAAAGSELIVQMDMRFAGPKARVGFLETSLAVFPAVGGLQFLGKIITKARALQYILSGEGADCKTGKEIGWFNDCYKSREELETKVQALAERIAQRPAGALNATKTQLATMNPSLTLLQDDLNALGPLQGTPEGEALTKKFLQLGNNQTRTPFELGLMQGTLEELFE